MAEEKTPKAPSGRCEGCDELYSECTCDDVDDEEQCEHCGEHYEYCECDGPYPDGGGDDEDDAA